MAKDVLYQKIDEGGRHKLDKYSKKVEIKFNIDFFEERLQVFALILIPAAVKDRNKNVIINSANNARKELILSKNFKISPCYSKVIIDGTERAIPEFFNREMMKKEDKNTWEIIFRQIFHKEIFNEVQKYKSQM